MILKSRRITLKEIKTSDLNDIHRLHSCPEVDQYNTLGIPKNIDETKKVLEPILKDQQSEIRKHYSWKIIENKNKIFIGLAGLINSCDRFKTGEIYYKLFPEYWGNGYATEAAKLMINFGFKQLKLHRIEAGAAVENIKSIRVLEKLSMTKEGIGRKILPIRGKWVDNYRYSIIEDDKRDY